MSVVLQWFGQSALHPEDSQTLPLSADAIAAPPTDTFSIDLNPLLAEIASGAIADEEDFQRIQETIRSKAWKDFQLPDKKQMAAFYGVRNELKIRRGLLFRGNQIIPPAMLRKEVIRCAHEGHPGIKRTKAALRSHL